MTIRRLAFAIRNLNLDLVSEAALNPLVAHGSIAWPGPSYFGL
jgi:hypothetical protein